MLETCCRVWSCATITFCIQKSGKLCSSSSLWSNQDLQGRRCFKVKNFTKSIVVVESRNCFWESRRSQFRVRTFWKTRKVCRRIIRKTSHRSRNHRMARITANGATWNSRLGSPGTTTYLKFLKITRLTRSTLLFPTSNSTRLQTKTSRISHSLTIRWIVCRG